MPVKPIACTGDAVATAGTLPSTKASSGTWTAGPLNATVYAHMAIQGAAALAQVSCTFAFSGVQGTTAVTDSSTVTLSPQTTVLQYGGAGVMRDGDTTQDGYGNTVHVSSGRILRTG